MADYTSPADEGFFAAIGRLAISWAHLEFSLDCIVEIMHYGFGGKDVEPEIPRALQRKIRYLRTMIKQIPLPADAAQGFQNLFDQIEAAAQIRHNVIHGIIIEQAERSGEATMVRAIRRKGGVSKRQFKMTTKDILRAAGQAQCLSSKTFHWLTETHNLISELRKQNEEQTPS